MPEEDNTYLKIYIFSIFQLYIKYLEIPEKK